MTTPPTTEPSEAEIDPKPTTRWMTVPHIPTRKMAAAMRECESGNFTIEQAWSYILSSAPEQPQLDHPIELLDVLARILDMAEYPLSRPLLRGYSALTHKEAAERYAETCQFIVQAARAALRAAARVRKEQGNG